MMHKYFLTRGLNFICSTTRTRTSSFAPNPNCKPPSLASFYYHTSKSDSHHSDNEIHHDNPPAVDDVSSAELKTQIDKFYKGDFEAIPDIFESILKRKLAGKHQDSDDELMNEFRQGQPDVDIDGFSSSSSSSSNSDTESDSDDE